VIVNDADNDGICDDEEQPDVCGDPIADINEPQTVRGIHDSTASQYEGSCGGSGDEDVINFLLMETGTYCLDTKGSRGPAFLYVRETCENSDTEIGCAVSAAMGTEFVATLELTLTAGQTYAIFIDAGTEPLNWMLNIRLGECAGTPPPAECVEDSECDGYLCVEGTCGGSCATNEECTDDFICREGRCIEAIVSPNACLSRQPITIVPGMGITGNSTNNPTAASGSCGGAGAEQVVVFNPRSDGAYCLSTQGSQFPTALYVRKALCTDESAEIACGRSEAVIRDMSTTSFATIDINVQSGVTYYIFVDGLSVGSSGSWALSLSTGTCDGGSDSNNGGNNPIDPSEGS
jgi:hypothetical protein